MTSTIIATGIGISMIGMDTMTNKVRHGGIQTATTITIHGTADIITVTMDVITTMMDIHGVHQTTKEIIVTTITGIMKITNTAAGMTRTVTTSAMTDVTTMITTIIATGTNTTMMITSMIIGTLQKDMTLTIGMITARNIMMNT